MIPYKYLKPIASVLLIAFFASCTSTYEVTKRSDFADTESLGTLKIYTKDNKFYELEKFRLSDSTITGYGFCNKKTFNGSVNINQIKRIESVQTNTGVTILSIGIGVAVLATFLTFMSKDRNINNEVRIIHPGGGCSMGMNYNDLRPLAGGSSILSFNLPDFSKKKFLNLTGKTDTLHFEVSGSMDKELHFEMIQSLPEGIDSEEIYTIDIDQL